MPRRGPLREKTITHALDISTNKKSACDHVGNFRKQFKIELGFHLHLKTRPGPPSVRLNVPTVSLLPVVTVSVIRLPSVQPVYRAGWLESASSTRIGPPCSRACVPLRSNRPCRSTTSGPLI